MGFGDGGGFAGRLTDTSGSVNRHHGPRRRTNHTPGSNNDNTNTGGGGNNGGNGGNGNGGNGGGGHDGLGHPFDPTHVHLGVSPFSNNPFNAPTFGHAGRPLLSTSQGNQASGDTANHANVWAGLSNLAGISSSPLYGQNQADWYNAQEAKMYADWEGMRQTLGDPSTGKTPSYYEYLKAFPGVGGDTGLSLGGRLGQASNGQTSLGGSGLGIPGLTGAGHAGNGHAGGGPSPWLTQQWAPAWRNYWTARWQGLDPTQRGDHPEQFRAPTRVMQF